MFQMRLRWWHLLDGVGLAACWLAVAPSVNAHWVDSGEANRAPLAQAAVAMETAPMRQAASADPSPVQREAQQPIDAKPPNGSAAAGNVTADTVLRRLIAEALARNPEIKAAERERDAARYRVRPAGALDDPMLEAGIVNLPFPATSFRREDMTMKMLGLSQRIPYPGKRQLREELAEKEAQTVDYGYYEASNRIVRDVRTSYTDLLLVLETTRIVQRNRAVLEQFLKTAEVRYSLGQASQSDVLKAQTQLSKMLEELLRLDRERPAMQAELERALARSLREGEIGETALSAAPVQLDFAAIRTRAERSRPQFLALRSVIARAEKAIALARADYYPDFDVKLTYGQRDRTPEGMRREDMIGLSVAINLPIWQARKRDPRLAEALAMRDQAIEMLRAQLNELAAKLRQQTALAEQSGKSVQLYETGILPQARLAVEAALAAYRVNRVDFLTLLDSQMAVFNYEIARAQAAASVHKALAEIDLLAGEPTRPAPASDNGRTGP